MDYLLDSGKHPKLEQADFSGQREELNRFYKLNYQRLAWFNNKGLTPQGAELLSRLENLSAHGLNGRHFSAQYWSEEKAQPIPATLNRCRLTLVDTAMTITGLRYMEALGREDQHYTPADHLHQLSYHETPALLLSSLEPQFPAYRQLKSVLNQYRQYAKNPVFDQSLPVPVESVHPGDPYASMAQLVHRLQIWGDLHDLSPLIGETGYYEPGLEPAIKHFQERHGLTTDGILGKETFRALNVPMSERVQQIELSLFRWLQLPQDLGDRPLLVNIPQYKLLAYERQPDNHYQLSLDMDVIVGKTEEKHQTPVLSAEMTYLVFSPYWNIPYEIFRDEIYPKIVSDPTYIEDNNFEIVKEFAPATDVLPPSEENIASLLNGSLKLRQGIGGKNALGRVKFMLPNTHAVYLHDTPTKSLFKRKKRAFSHGCIRLAEPVALAEYVLREENDWPLNRIEGLLKSGERQVVSLSRPINVYLLYATAAADENGKVYFYQDIYDRDQKLARLLKKELAVPAPLASLARRGPDQYPGE